MATGLRLAHSLRPLEHDLDVEVLRKGTAETLLERSVPCFITPERSIAFQNHEVAR